MQRQVILTEQAPAPIGPYSQAVFVGDLLFVSGQIPLDPRSGMLTGATVAEQAGQALANLGAILAAAGLTMASLVKTTVFITDMSQFAAFNAVYEAVLSGSRPARSVVEVAALPKGALVEIEAVACR